MKKAMIKIFSGLMVALILLTGCVTKNNDNKKATSASTGNEVSVQQKPVKIMYPESRESNREDIDKVKKYIEEKSGVKFEAKILKTPHFIEQVNMSLASGEDIDMISVANNASLFTTLLERNALQKINDPIAKYGRNLTKMMSRDAWMANSDKAGDIYGIPAITSIVGDLIAIRKDWREKLKMEPITTLAELEEYLRDVKDGDLDGNGLKDTIPLTSYNIYEELDLTLLQIFTDTNAAVTMSSGVASYIDSNGKITPVVMHPKYKDYLRTLANWNKEGLLHSELSIVKSAQIDDLVMNNRIGAIATWYSNWVRPTEKLIAKVPEADYEYITPKTLSGKDYRLQTGSLARPGLVVVSYSKNAEFAVKLIDWQMASRENYWTTKQGIEGEHWKWINKDKGEVEKLKGKEKPETSYNYQFSFLFYPDWNARNANPGYVDKKYYDTMDWYIKYNSFVSPPDSFVNYKWKGTAIESSLQDGLKLIQENTAEIILGDKPIDEWDKVVEQYRKMFGDKFIELATQQYNEYKIRIKG